MDEREELLHFKSQMQFDETGECTITFFNGATKLAISFPEGPSEQDVDDLDMLIERLGDLIDAAVTEYEAIALIEEATDA